MRKLNLKIASLMVVLISLGLSSIVVAQPGPPPGGPGWGAPPPPPRHRHRGPDVNVYIDPGAIGLGFGSGSYYGNPYPYYDGYYPGGVVVSPPVIIDNSERYQEPEQELYWCEASKEYYPYVTSCSSGWVVRKK